MIANNQRKGIRACRGTGSLRFNLSLCLVMAWMAGCQGPSSTVATSAGSDGQTKAVERVGGKVSGEVSRITVEKDVCDLREIGMDTKHTGQFKFTNTGAAPLKIILVRTCCGVGIKGVEAGQQYAPGQSGTLQFEYQAPAIPHPAANRELSLQTNDPEHGTTTLTIKAAVVRRVDCSPKSLKLVLRRANADCPDIVLTSLDHRPFSIKEFRATSDTITAPFDSHTQATEFVLKPQVDMAKLQQNASGRISIDLTHPECTNVQLLYSVLPEFTVSPPNIMQFGLRAGQAVQKDISILSNYQGDFEIESVSSQKGTVKLLEQTKVANGCQLRIEITPPAQEGQNASLSDMLHVKIKDGQTLSIPLRGFYQEK
jgi:hypothetical protein